MGKAIARVAHESRIKRFPYIATVTESIFSAAVSTAAQGGKGVSQTTTDHGLVLNAVTDHGKRFLLE